MAISGPGLRRSSSAPSLHTNAATPPTLSSLSSANLTGGGSDTSATKQQAPGLPPPPGTSGKALQGALPGKPITKRAPVPTNPSVNEGFMKAVQQFLQGGGSLDNRAKILELAQENPSKQIGGEDFARAVRDHLASGAPWDHQAFLALAATQDPSQNP